MTCRLVALAGVTLLALALAAGCSNPETSGTVVVHAVQRTGCGGCSGDQNALSKSPVAASVVLLAASGRIHTTTSRRTGLATITVSPGTYRVRAAMTKAWPGSCRSRPNLIHVAALRRVTVHLSCRPAIGGG